MKILVADDEKEIRKILRILLESKSYKVVEAQDGNAAVQALTEDKDIDLCIMDIMMPNLSGVDAVARIRNFSDVPVLFLTAKSLDSDKEEAYSKGGDDYLVKPFAAKELLLKVEALTRRYNRYGAKSDSSADVIKLGFGSTHLALVSISFTAFAMNSSTEIAPRFLPSRVRTETVPFSTSLSPITSI